MKRFFLAAACISALALSGTSATAQTPVQGVVTGDCGKPGGCGAAATVGSVFSRLAWWKSSSCSTCGHGHGHSFRSWTNNAAGLPMGGGAGAAAAFNPYPQGTPGTLVFPQHQFVRSPRDFFMTDAR